MRYCSPRLTFSVLPLETAEIHQQRYIAPQGVLDIRLGVLAVRGEQVFRLRGVAVAAPDAVVVLRPQVLLAAVGTQMAVFQGAFVPFREPWQVEIAVGEGRGQLVPGRRAEFGGVLATEDIDVARRDTGGQGSG